MPAFHISCIDRKPISVAVLDNDMQLRMNDILIDENGNTFTVKGFEMFRFVTNEFPDWYLKISFVMLEGDFNNMGDYLSHKDTVLIR